MLTEISLLVGVLAGAFLSGAAGFLVGHLKERNRLRDQTVDCEGDWRRHSSELARNLLVLETVGDEILSTPLDVAVRARLTPTEMRQATDELSAAGLVDQPSSNLIRLTGSGKEVLHRHKIELEESSLHRKPRSPRRSANIDDLDHAIERAVATLRTQHAH